MGTCADMSRSNHDPRQFWNDRTRRFKHTGWADGTIYAFDQPARLLAIEHIIVQVLSSQKSVLDFGTGSGDFAALLSKTFVRVIASDISNEVIEIARQYHSLKENIEFICTDDVNTLPIEPHTLDMVLSITVLGHILKDSSLKATLEKFRQMLGTSGLLLAMEYTPRHEMTASAYQRFRSYDEWKSIFAESGFELECCFGFYHPSEAPCPSYRRYRRHPLLKILSKAPHFFKSQRWVKRFCQRRAERILNGATDMWWEAKDQDVLRIMVFRPMSAGE